MKQKTIIQMWGTQGNGKTSTIQLIKEELIKSYINPAHIYTFPLPKAEISELLTCSGYIVGIESVGDDINYHNLRGKLDNFIKIKSVDLLVCASRVHNNVDRHLKGLASTNNYRILSVTNYRSKDSGFIQDDLNLLSAKQIVSLIDQVFIGAI